MCSNSTVTREVATGGSNYLRELSVKYALNKQVLFST